MPVCTEGQAMYSSDTIEVMGAYLVHAPVSWKEFLHFNIATAADMTHLQEFQ